MIGGVVHQLLRSFQRPSYRYLWFSDSLTSSAEQMEFLVLAWFVLIETDSAFLVGLYGALRFTGTLFAPFYGVIVDRYDRMQLLTTSRLGFAGIALLIAFLSFTGRFEVWHVFVLTTLMGMGRAFDNVTRQTLVADLVDRSDLPNAVALTRTGRDATQIIGPIIGGFMLDQTGLGWTYVLVLALYLSGVLLVSRMRPPRRSPTGAATSVLGNLSETFRYVRKEEVILALLLMAFVVNLTGLTLNQGLMPVFAREALGTDAVGLGQLLGAYSAGAFVSSIFIAGVPRIRRLGRVMVVSSIGWHGAILVISQLKWFGASIGVLAITGMSQSFTMVTMAILLLGSTSTDIRGRVMGMRSLAVYGLPIGLLLSGAIADNLSVSAALIINGLVGISVTAAIAILLRGLWRES